MKRFTILLALMVTTGALFAQGTLTVTSVVSTPVTGITEITYDLEGSVLNYGISVDVSFNNGLSYLPVPPAHLSGDVANVVPGINKKITWDGAAGFPNRYSEQTRVRLTANTAENFVCGTTTVFFIYNGNPVTYGTVQSSGKCWLDRNLGASQVATISTDAASYGDLFQWGRFDEGHQVRANTVHYDAGLASTSEPNAGNAWDGKFIINGSSPDDWLSTPDDNLWQGVNGINNPCPPGYRVPTDVEWNEERASWGSSNSAGAFASPLKLPVAGYRSYYNGSLFVAGSLGSYWSSTVDGINSRYLHFNSDDAFMSIDYRAGGYSVRCLKDN